MSAHWLILLLIVISGDLRGFTAFVISRGCDAPEKLEPEHIIAYLASEKQHGKSASTIGRKASSIRGFCRFLFMERRQDKDISQNTQTPKRQRPLPQVLSQEEMGQVACFHLIPLL